MENKVKNIIEKIRRLSNYWHPNKVQIQDDVENDLHINFSMFLWDENDMKDLYVCLVLIKERNGNEAWMDVCAVSNKNYKHPSTTIETVEKIIDGMIQQLEPQNQ